MITYNSLPEVRAAALQYLEDKPWVGTVDIVGPSKDGKFWIEPGTGRRPDIQLFGPYAGSPEDEVAGS